jgi:hypothetical protein
MAWWSPWVARLPAPQSLQALRTFLEAQDFETAALREVAVLLRKVDARAARGDGRAEAPDADASLDALEAAVVSALAQRICRPDGPDLPTPDGAAATRFVEGYLQGLPPEQGLRLRDLLALWEYQPLAFGPRRTRFTLLTPDEQDANLEQWAASTVPQRIAVFKALRTLCMLWYWSQPATWPAIRYDGPTVPRGYTGGMTDWPGAALGNPMQNGGSP